MEIAQGGAARNPGDPPPHKPLAPEGRLKRSRLSHKMASNHVPHLLLCIISLRVLHEEPHEIHRTGTPEASRRLHGRHRPQTGNESTRGRWNRRPRPSLALNSIFETACPRPTRNQERLLALDERNRRHQQFSMAGGLWSVLRRMLTGEYHPDLHRAPARAPPKA